MHGRYAINRYMNTTLMGVEEAAAALGLSRSGILARVNRGELTPMARLGKKGVCIFSADVIRAIAHHEGKEVASNA